MIYEAECANGKGNVAACRPLITVRAKARGVAIDLVGAIELARTLCEKRRDGYGCLVFAFSGQNPNEAAVKTLEAALAEPCDEKHLDRCALPRDPFSWMSQSGSVDFENMEFDLRGCKLGVLEACLRRRYGEGKERDEAMAVVAAACARGDAEACEVVDRPIDAVELCAAKDYAACAAVGCAGDQEAAQFATEHGAPLRCGGPDYRVARARTFPLITTPGSRTGS